MINKFIKEKGIGEYQGIGHFVKAFRIKYDDRILYRDRLMNMYLDSLEKSSKNLFKPSLLKDNK